MVVNELKKYHTVVLVPSTETTSLIPPALFAASIPQSPTATIAKTLTQVAFPILVDSLLLVASNGPEITLVKRARRTRRK